MASRSMKITLKLLRIIVGVVCVIITFIPALLEAVFKLAWPRKTKDVKGQVALITGAAQGIGREIALELSRRGCNVICVDVNAEGNERTSEELIKRGVKSKAYTCDVSNREAVSELARKVDQIDILINNAGIILFDSLLDTPPDKIQRVLDVNVASHYWMINAFLPRMIERDSGHIVGIASCAGLYPLPSANVYTASKFAVVGLMSCLQEELKEKNIHNIKVCCVCPFFVRTVKEIDTRIKSCIPPLQTKEAALSIVEGFLKDLSMFTIPRHTQAYILFLRILPQRTQDMFKNIFYNYVQPRNSAPSPEIIEQKSK